ncbi:M16 family metallopeptidase [Armatimonas rosea]|uniref:Zinc protease n=1 Tax=Armatimonas rosea TaxID=685828 RepID=A0A7W9SNN8_ARMRO|nr:pitrilysin family protein [Armatimonas rosea]MBB6049946.1 zinc protease [Armatimonas rosea]
MLPPPLVFRRRVLPNGLVVLTHEDHKSPTVALQVWYKVGAKDDPAGKSGFAHLFEHLMFKRSKNMPDEQLDRFTEDVGGENNAYTTPDVTVYHEVVPSNHLERLLWAEADRMASLQVDESNFFSERDVVKEEYRQGVLANPYGRLDDALESGSWSIHPYKRPVIGNIAELDAATLDDVRAFHATFYRPDNAVLIVTGDLDPAQCDRWIDQYFGRITRPESTIPRVTVKEPARRAAQRREVHGPSVPLPALALSFLVPNQRHPDAPALQLLDSLLSSGESARLHQSLVYKQQLASEASTGADLRTDAGMFTVHCTTAGGKSLDVLLRATLAELEKVKRQPVSPKELARARTRLLAGTLHERETAEGVAGALGTAEVLFGRAERVNTELPELLAVTAADIQRVAQRYLTEKNSLLIRYTTGKASEPPLSPKKTAPKATPPPPEEPAPTPSAPRPARLPVLTDRSLANGLRVVHAARPGSGLVTLELVVPGGSGIVPAAKAGLASLTATLLTRGTTTGKTAPQLAAEAEALGGSLGAGADSDSLSVGITVPQGNAAAALALLAEVVQKPAFSQDEVARAKSEAIDEVTQALEEPSTLARGIAQRLFFGTSSYGNRLGGLPSTLAKLGAGEVRGYWQQVFTPHRATLIVTGDLTAAAALALAQRHLGSWRTKPLPLPTPGVAFQKVPPVVVLDKPDAGQAAVLLALPSLRRADPSYAIGEVANSLLGGGYSSRVNRMVRIERGLSYGAGSGLGTRRYAGLFQLSCQTKNESAAEVATLFVDALKNLATAPIPETELAARKSALLGPLTRELETGTGLAGALSERVGDGLPLDELAQLLATIPSITEAQVQAFAAQTLAAEKARIVIVGDAKQFRPALEKAFGPVTVWKKWSG